MRVIVTDCDHDNMIQETEVFARAGMTFEHLTCKTEEDLIEQAKGGEIMLTQYGPFSERVMRALRPELKQILRYGVGVNTIDLKAAEELGIQVCNVPDYGMNEVADQAMGLMLGLVRKICEMNECTKHKTWNYTEAIPVRRIPGSTVGIVGLGRIGQTFAKRMGGFDCRLIAYDTAYEVGTQVKGVEIVDFDMLLRESDMISIHCPLTPESENMFDRKAFEQMKDTAFLINTARGGIVNEADLLAALQEKMIAGAALDVVAVEPMEVGAALFAFDNFLCSPHMAWYSQESSLELKRKIAEEAVRFANGEPVKYPVNHPKMVDSYYPQGISMDS